MLAIKCLLLLLSCCLVFCTFRKTKEHYKQEVDFDEWTRQWVYENGRSVNRQVSWWDAYGKHKHLTERPQYHKYKVNARADQVVYGKVISSVDQPSTVYTQWFHNVQESEKQTIQIRRTVHRMKSFQWSQERIIKIGLQIDASAKIPGILDVSSSFSTDINLQKGEVKSEIESETFTIDQQIIIPSKTSVKAEWIITEKQTVIPWTADMHIDGYVAVWYNTKWNGHWLWFYPTHYLANQDFKADGDGLKFTARGTFSGVLGKESVLKVEEHKLVLSGGNPDYSKPIRTTYYKIPLRQ